MPGFAGINSERSNARTNTWHKTGQDDKIKQLQEALNHSENRGSVEQQQGSGVAPDPHEAVPLGADGQPLPNFIANRTASRASSRGQPQNPPAHGYQPVPTFVKEEEDTDGVAPLKNQICPMPLQTQEMDMAAVINCVVRELRVALPEALEFRKDDLRVPSDVIWAPLDKLDTPERKGVCCLCLIRFGTATEQIITRLLQFLALVDFIYVPFILAFASVYPVHHFQQVWMTDSALNVIYFVLAVPIRLRTSMVCTKTRDEITDPAVLWRRLRGNVTLWADVVAVLLGPMVYADLFALRVRHRYLKEELHLEVSYVLAFSLQLRWLGVIRIIKVWRLKPDGSRTMLLGTSHFVEEVAEIVMAIFLTAHIFGCVWFWAKTQSPEGYGHEWTAFNGWSADALNVSEVEVTSLSTPLHSDDLMELPLDYFRSFKDGIYMLAGWGGPDSTSHVEVGIACILGPLSSIVSGLIISRLMQVNEKQSCLENQYAYKMAAINAACDGMELPQDLRGRINRYHSYMSFHQMDQSSQDMLYAGLSVNLLAEVKLHCMRGVIAGTSFFEGLPPRLISFLVVSFEETTFSPGDVIVRKNEIGDMMYIIMRGRVGIYVEEFVAEPVAYKYPGNYFGEISLVFPMPRTAWIRAVHYVVLMQLNKEKFDYILAECPQEKNTLLSRIVQDFRHLVPDLDALSGDEGMNLIMQELTKAEENVDQGRRGSVWQSSSPIGASPSLTFGSRDGSRENSARALSGRKQSTRPLPSTDNEARKEGGVSFGEVNVEGVESIVLGDTPRESSPPQLHKADTFVEEDPYGENEFEGLDSENRKVVEAMHRFADANKRKSMVSLAAMQRAGAVGKPRLGMPRAIAFQDDDDFMDGTSSMNFRIQKDRMAPVDNLKLEDLVERVRRVEDMMEQVATKLGCDVPEMIEAPSMSNASAIGVAEASRKANAKGKRATKFEYETMAPKANVRGTSVRAPRPAGSVYMGRRF